MTIWVKSKVAQEINIQKIYGGQLAMVKKWLKFEIMAKWLYAPFSDCLLLDFGGSYLPAMLLLICCSLFGLVSFLVFTWHNMIWWFTMGSDKRIDSCIRWTTQSLSSTGVFFSPNPRERGWWALFQNMTPYIKRKRWTTGGAYYNHKKNFFGSGE